MHSLSSAPPVYIHVHVHVVTYMVQFGREVGVHELEEEVSERPDLCPAGHVDTLGSEGGSEGEMGAGEGESS